MSKNIENLKLKLAKYGVPHVVKDTGTSLIVFLTGEKLDSIKTIFDIGKLTSIFEDKYPIVEVMKNEETFFLYILKPAS